MFGFRQHKGRAPLSEEWKNKAAWRTVQPLRTRTVTLEGGSVVVGAKVVEVDVVTTPLGRLTLVTGTVVRVVVGGTRVATVLGAPPVRARTKTPTTTARTTTNAALNGWNCRGWP